MSIGADDIQDLKTAHGAEIWAKYINRNTGRRSDAATAYVHSVMDEQSNLHLRTNARVSRVIFDGDRAVGVAYVPSRNRAHQGQYKETIVSNSSCGPSSARTGDASKLRSARTSTSCSRPVRWARPRSSSARVSAARISCRSSTSSALVTSPGSASNTKTTTRRFPVSLVVSYSFPADSLPFPSLPRERGDADSRRLPSWGPGGAPGALPGVGDEP